MLFGLSERRRRSLIAVSVACLAGCGGSGSSSDDLAERFGRDAAAAYREHGLKAHDPSCSGSTCTIRIGDGGKAEYAVEACGETYDARAKPPPAPQAAVFHVGGDCRTAQDRPQRTAALAAVKVRDAAGCRQSWSTQLQGECRRYVAKGSPYANARIAYVVHRFDGTIEVALTGPPGLAVTVAPQSGRQVVDSVTNF